MISPRVREYLLTALAGTPSIIGQMCAALSPGDVRWDARPDPERFTLREIIAHFATIESTWHTWAVSTCEKENPLLPSRPPDTDYSESDPTVMLAQFRVQRQSYVAILQSLNEAQWKRQGHSQGLGTMTIESQALTILTHDGYHTEQIAEWLSHTMPGTAMSGNQLLSR